MIAGIYICFSFVATVDVTSYCSNIACAFVPPNPKQLTHAILGLNLDGIHFREVVGTTKLYESKSIFGFPFVFVYINDGAIVSYFIISRTLITPATPAAASVWPMLDLTDPMLMLLVDLLFSLKNFPRAFASIGSPTGVPVPIKANSDQLVN